MNNTVKITAQRTLLNSAICLLIGIGVGVACAGRSKPDVPVGDVDLAQPFTIREGPGPVTTLRPHSVVVENRSQYFCEPGEGPVVFIAFENGRAIVVSNPTND